MCVNPLTGLRDLAPNAAGRRPVAVMVENTPPARPQWGLSTPDLVIEGEVEGGITRMLWLYADISKAPKLGPVRSARHDYVELAEGFDAVYAHLGGSNLAYDKLQADRVSDIDGGRADGRYFARDKSRNVSREHTAYTTGENLAKAIAARKYRMEIRPDYAAPFSFAAEKRTPAGGSCGAVTAVFSGSYRHTFRYDEQSGLYINHMNKSEMKDANGETMKVANVIILYTDVSGPLDSAHHIDWDLKGGKGVYASDGAYEDITWSKGSSGDMLVLRAEDGSVLRLNPGKSWIGFVRSSRSSATVIEPAPSV